MDLHPFLLRAAGLAAALALLSPNAASGGPPTSDDIGAKPDPVAGWVCYWLCYGACVLLGNSGSQCDAACTDSCFTIVDRPTCDDDSDRVCA